jgi:putative acetyltransferase
LYHLNRGFFRFGAACQCFFGEHGGQDFELAAATLACPVTKRTQWPQSHSGQTTRIARGGSDMTPEAPARQFHIRIDHELTHPQVIALLEEHLAGMRAASPPECVFALDLDGLRRPEITFLTAWRRPAGAPTGTPAGGEGELVAMGALKELTPSTATKGGHGELKSMRTSAHHLRQGAAQAILTELLNLARQRGYARVSLETGSTPPFGAAIAMYRRFGFVECGPFADYREDPFSRFMKVQLDTQSF